MFRENFEVSYYYRISGDGFAMFVNFRKLDTRREHLGLWLFEVYSFIAVL